MGNGRKKLLDTIHSALESFHRAVHEFRKPKLKEEGIKCWEYFQCGQEITKECPAVTKSAGRKCWLVAGTFCGTRPKSQRALELRNCKACEFYQLVHREEGRSVE